MSRHRVLAAWIVVILLAAGCRAAPSAPTAAPLPSQPPPTVAAPHPTVLVAPTVPPTPTAGPEAGLSADEAATLASLEQVDDHPLYVLHYQGSYAESASRLLSWRDPSFGPKQPSSPAWACSLFAALGDAGSRVYGRNFDWRFSPALLLYTDPPDGYASVSMVDIEYLGFGGSESRHLLELPLEERRALLAAPSLPFDGMNDQGLVVGMAAVPSGGERPDPARETLDSLAVIREMLDHAGNVDEALAILQSYNIDWGGGPPLHYLIADRSGRALLVEFYQGERVVLPNKGPWHLATNYLRAAVSGSGEGECWRYDRIDERLSQAGGRLDPQEAMDLLASVAQGETQWSVVYGMSSGGLNVVMDRHYDQAHNFQLDLTAQAAGESQQAGALRMITVYDNTVYQPGLEADWGFGAWLEYGGHVVLFDTGGRGRILLDNMAKLGLDPRRIEAVVLSHIHGDHTGGLEDLLRTGVEPVVYVPASFPEAFKEQVRARTRLVEVAGPVEILPGMHSTGEIWGAVREQGLAVETSEGVVVITGCAHPGVVRMVQVASDVAGDEIALVVGGYHLGSTPESAVRRIVQDFRELGVRQVSPTHCTGERAIAIFAQEYGEGYIAGGVGQKYEIGDAP